MDFLGIFLVVNLASSIPFLSRVSPHYGELQALRLNVTGIQITAAIKYRFSYIFPQKEADKFMTIGQ